MPVSRRAALSALLFAAVLPAADPPATAKEPISAAHRLEPIQYNNPGLVVDLGVGLWAWPLPMDYDRDGDLDLVVSCPDKPYNGTYLFENPGAVLEVGGQKSEIRGPIAPSAQQHAGGLAPPANSLPIFKPAVRIADGPTNVQVSYIDGEPVVMTPAKIYADFRTDQYAKPIKLPLPDKLDPQYKRYRANQWKLLDWEGDGDLDVIAGIEIWDDYGWDDAWDAEGNWKNGPLHGFVYLVENVTPQSRDRQKASGEAVDSPERSEVGDQKSESKDQPPDATIGAAERLRFSARLAALATAQFAAPRKLTTTDGNPIDVYGMPSPNFADFNGDGALDLICGEFLDGFTYFRNVGTRHEPQFVDGVQLTDPNRERRLHMDLQMITPVSIDWDDDGDIDLICGDEDGRVAFIENTNEVPEGIPHFKTPLYFCQQAAELKFGALVTPFCVDWDHDGDEDILCGNTAGQVAMFDNQGGGDKPQWARPKLLTTLREDDILERESYRGLLLMTESKLIRHEARRKGSIQGPCEAKWGYTTLSVAQWDGQHDTDLVVNDIWGKVVLYRRKHRSLVQAQAVIVDWSGKPQKPAWTWWSPAANELATQWRTTPCAVDWNTDGLTDLVMLDHEGYLAIYQRARRAAGASPLIGRKAEEQPGATSNTKTRGEPNQPAHAGRSPDDLVLLPPQRLFRITGPCEFDQKHKPVGDKRDGLLRLNANRAGASGRRKLHFVDWDGDGRLDLLVNSVNVNWLRNVRTDDEGFTWFADMGQLDDRVLAGHDTAPASVDWDKNGIPDLLVGAEDGRLYFKPNPRTEPTEIEKHRLARIKGETTASTDQ